ncbi:MAG: oligosaccharide flippase family protein [Candidatus Spyradocola sp.]|jgi:stage V sporulation protein B
MNRNKAIQGVMLLTMSSFFLRGIGMLYRIVLSERIGMEGMGLYQLIMTVYGLFSMLACAGLTITVSRLCAERPEAARSAVHAASLYAGVLGLVLGMGLYFAADGIAANLLGDARASKALKWIAPSLPMMGISAALRGYFLSRGDVAHPTIAQMTEQVVRVGLVLFLLFSLKIEELSQACAAILFGATAAEAVSLLLCGLFYARSGEATLERIPLRDVLTGVLPIWLGALLQCGMQTAENLLIPVLLKLSGASASHALEQYGLLSGMVLPILLFPAAFPAAVGTLLLPEIARESARGRPERVRALTRKTLAAAVYMAVFFCALFLLFGQNLMDLLYGNEAAGGLLTLLTPLLPLLYVESICDAMLKGLGRQGATLVIETVDSALRILGILVLLPRLGMMGYVGILYLSGVLCALTRLKLLLRFTGMDRKELLLLLFEPVTMLRQLRASRK